MLFETLEQWKSIQLNTILFIIGSFEDFRKKQWFNLNNEAIKHNDLSNNLFKKCKANITQQKYTINT